MAQTESTSSKTALLLLDFHASIVELHGESGRRAVSAASSALAKARHGQLAIFHVVPHYRSDYPELPAGTPFDEVKAAGLFRESTASIGIATALQPQRHEPVVAKCRYSPFFASDLENLLRMRKIETVVLCGISTSGVVLSAVRAAWDLDYRILVLQDACADQDTVVHQFVLERILAKQSIITTVEDWSVI